MTTHNGLTVLAFFDCLLIATAVHSHSACVCVNSFSNYSYLQVMICLEIMSNGDLRNYLRGIDMARYEAQICVTN